jgi:hypothetical protein
MLFVTTNLTKFKEFRDNFKKSHENLTFLDLSKVPSKQLSDESNSIVDHHKNACIFLGYLEPGWMLEPSQQTQLRKLFRKFPVAMLTHFTESLPFSWKNEIDTIYIGSPVNGNSNSLDNGSAVQDQSEIRYDKTSGNSSD